MTAEMEAQENEGARIGGSFPKSVKAVKRKDANKSKENGSPSREIKPAASAVSLQKNIDFFSCLGILVGSIIGSGIFVSPKGVLIGSGSVGASMIVWAVCGVMALTGALAYAELGILLPNSGGQFIYILEAFHPKRKEERSFWGSLAPFLFFWQYSLFSRPAAIAVQGMAIGQYIIQLASRGGCGSTLSKEDSVIFTRALSIVFIMLITFMNCYSNKLSTRVINILTFAKLTALAFVIISGLTKLSLGTNGALKTGFEGTSLDGIADAFYSGLWAYQGWYKLNMVTRELSNPKRDLLRSLIASSIIITTLYLLVNISYFAVLSKESFFASDAVAADFADNIIGKPGAIFIIISVALSIFGSAIGSNFTANRVMYAASREGHMADIFSYIHYEKMTPSTALTLTGIIAILLTPNSSILGLISLTGFISAIFQFLTFMALLILRKNRKRDENDYQVPFVFILVNMIIAIAFIIVPFIKKPKLEYIFIISFMLIGIPVYTIFVYYKKSVPGFHKVTILVQKILGVVPPEDDEV